MTSSRRIPLLLMVLLFGLVVYGNAWLCDDAFISFRCADHLADGHGLRWNVAERVQAFTNPLWTLLIAVILSFTDAIWLGSLVLSLVMSAAMAALYAFGVRRPVAWTVLGLVLILTSRAFVDYSTSGLENPLSHLLLVACGLLLAREGDSRGRALCLALLVSLLLLNRADLLLLVGPALAVVTWQGRKVGAVGGVLLGLSPVLAWEIFAILYYGFPFPNTAYAKLSSGVGASALLRQGTWYFANVASRDTLTAAIILAGLVAGWRTGDPRRRALTAGILLYLLYVLRIGGDFMAGRFFAAPFLVAVMILTWPGRYADLRPHRALAWRAVLAVVLWTVVISHSPLRTGKHTYEGVEPRDLLDGHGIADERGAYYRATSPLWRRESPQMPDHEWADWGRRMRASGTEATVALNAAGMRAYFAGPRIHVIDRFGLGDPLLARLPIDPDEYWRIGHFRRDLPEGYQQTVNSGTIQLLDPDLGRYVRKMNLVTRGSIFSAQRLRAIWELNTGRLADLLRRR